MLPTDRTLSIRSTWKVTYPDLDAIANDGSDRLEEFRKGERTAHAVQMKGRELPIAYGMPLPVLTAVPYRGVQDIHEVAKRVRSFVDEASRATAGIAPFAGRAKRLFAMPLFAASGGGGQAFLGSLIHAELVAAQTAAEDNDVDVVLVLRNSDEMHLAQQIRLKEVGRHWPALTEDLREEARELGLRASQGKLVPFMGAGVSKSAGLPTWQELLSGLAQELGVDENALEKFDELLRAEVLEVFSADPNAENDDAKLAFKKRVAARIEKKTKYGLAPALLASLPVNEAITLNYDELFEIATADTGRTCSVIPAQDARQSDRWLLKMHGSVENPESIVLTREDYLSFDRNSRALSALVQANLMTRTLLFVGFGLTDEHFLRVMHEVRAASKELTQHSTALVLRHDQASSRLWETKLKLVSMGSSGSDTSENARRQEVFLDLMLAHSLLGHEYLLHPSYESQLSPAELGVKHRIEDLISTLESSAADEGLRTAVESALAPFGYRGIAR